METNAQPEPSPAVLYRLSVDATLAAVREGKQLPACTDDATSLKEKEQRELFARLQAELARLPEQRRRAVALHLISLTTAEIKDLLHWKEPKARDQIDRGWRTLQTKLQGHAVAELTALYQSQPSRTELNRADCLADEFLVRACMGDISDSDRLFVADHLMTCQDCAEEFRLAYALKAWPDNAASLPVETKETEASEEKNELITEVITELPVSHVAEADTATETTPKWWQALIPHFVYYTGFNLFTAALTSLFFITSLWNSSSRRACSTR